MAEALAKRGLKVHVVEKLPHVMAVMDPEISGFVEEEMTAHGVDLHKNLGVSEIGESWVKLEDGSKIDADLVLLSIGVRPPCSWPRMPVWNWVVRETSVDATSERSALERRRHGGDRRSTPKVRTHG